MNKLLSIKLSLINLGLYLAIVYSVTSLSAILVAKPIENIFRFPPSTLEFSEPEFSWPVFGLLAALIIAIMVPIGFVLVKFSSYSAKHQYKSHVLPWWGWLSFIGLIIFWSLAWTRMDWMQPYQQYTYTPLWLAYIGVINALSYHRCGCCLLMNRSVYFFFLFPVSAVFWWSFEYLNLYVANWQYLEINHSTAFAYLFWMTLAFSTVLPAVLSTAEYLSTFHRFELAAQDISIFKLSNSNLLSWSFILASVLMIFLLIAEPTQFFPLLWFFPLLLIPGLHQLRKSVNENHTTYSWPKLLQLILASLMCGFFWEMWNYFSLAHWEYHIPYVNRFKVFEMPFIGYAGYLPFGIVCGLFADYVLLYSVWCQHKV